MREQEVVIKRLQAILDELEAAALLPRSGSPEAMADHDGWMARNKAIQEKMHEAEVTARAALPTGVMLLLFKINNRAFALFNIEPIGGQDRG